MGFLGDVTHLGPIRLRPHDIEVAVAPAHAGALPGVVTRALRVGFEVRLTVEPDTTAAGWARPGSEVEPGSPGEPVSVVLTRTHARSLGIDVGTRVWLTAADGATTVPSMVAV